MADKAKLETVLEDPELPHTTTIDRAKDVQQSDDRQAKGKGTTKKVVVDIQLPIVTEIGLSRESTRENSASNDKESGDRKDENNNLSTFMEEVAENLAPNEVTDEIYKAFTRTDTVISKASSVCIPSPQRQSARKKSAKQPRANSSAVFTKKELELFLPRKTFFSAHDKELREAGYQIDNSEQRKKPNWRAMLKMHTMEELYPPDIEPEEQKTAFTMDIESDDEEDAEGNNLENVETAMSGGVHAPIHKTKRSKKKQLANEKEEFKQLYDYLKYIQDHPDEYKTMSKYTPKNNDYKHPTQIVRLGRVYRRWHHGTLKSSIYQHALNGLKASPEPEVRRSQMTRRDTSDAVDQTPVQEESEIEKLKNKTEKWLQALPTHQQLKVKELALKDVGDEDVSISKWWLTFKSCHYIRVPQHLS